MKTFYLVVTVLVFMLMQATLAGWMEFSSIGPDFILLIVAFFALRRGVIAGAIFGFVVGFCQDLGNPDLLGLNALLKAVVGFSVGRAGEKAFPDSALFLFGLLCAVVLGHDIVYLFVYRWPNVLGAMGAIVMPALPSAVYTAIVGVSVDRAMVMLGAKAGSARGEARK